MKFSYQARDKEGTLKTGKIEASSGEAATEVLRKRGLFITSLRKERSSFLSFEKIKSKIFKGVSSKEVAIFSHQLGVMLDSRVPIVQSLLTLSSQMSNTNFKEKVLKISEAVEGGSSLSDAFSVYPEIFDNFYISLLESGEAAGKISESLHYLGDHLEREYNIKSDIKKAMLYPVLVLIVFLVAITVIVFFVIPPFSEILQEAGGEIPLITRLMFGFYEFLKNFGWVLILAFGGLIVFLIYYLKTEKGRKIYDKIIINLPFLGNFFQKIFMTRFAENLSSLIKAGIPITQALRINKKIIGNFVYQEILKETEKRVAQGEQISYVLVKYPEVIPSFVTQMVKVGEKTGRLESSLSEVVKFYQKEIQRSTETFMTLIEPILIIFLGGIVALLAVSVFGPLYGMIGGF